MRRVTKLLFLTLSLFLISNFAFSQEQTENHYSGAGIYKTYKDYLNKKVTKYGYFVTTYKSIAVFEDDEGNKTEISMKDGKVWGYRNNSEGDYRVNEKGSGHKVLIVGKIFLYGDKSESGYTTSEVYTGSGSGSGPAFSTRSSLKYFSFGVNGEMKQAIDLYIRKILKKQKDKEGLKMLKKVSVFRGYYIENFISDYNERFK